MDMTSLGRPFLNPQSPAPNANEQAQYLRLLIQSSGSEQLKKMVSEGQVSDDELVQFVMEHPEELQGPRGQGSAFAFAVAGSTKASATSSASSASSAAPGDSFSGSEEDDEGDSDLKPFSQDETMAAPSMCAMGGVSSADKAKPEMQQNLKECKAISKALSELQSQDEESGSSGLSAAVAELRSKEQIIRSCLKRGKGAANDSYQSQGVDPKDEASVSSFVARIGKEVIDIGTKCGLEIEVSEKRASRLQAGGLNPGGAAAAEAGAPGGGKNGAAVQGGEKNGATVQGGDKGKTPGSPQDKAQGANQGQGGGDDDVFQITTQKTEKQIEVGADEVASNPAMAGAMIDQLTAMWEQKQAMGDAFQPPAVLDLGETRQGSPLDQAFSAPRPGAPGENGQQAAGPGAGGGFGAPMAAPAPWPSTNGANGAQGVGPAAGRPMPAGGAGAGRAPRDLQSLMAALGMSGKKFSAKIHVFEPNAQVSMSKGGGGGGVKVNGNLSGKAINVKIPKMVGRAADGSLHALSGLSRVDNGGSFIASVRGEATGAEAAKQLHTTGNGSISIPGTKAN
ncbi:hypothetical protein DYH09_05655 [bacterium CPR1]|nr:hypothetical protein [bacterium CPR1]